MQKEKFLSIKVNDEVVRMAGAMTAGRPNIASERYVKRLIRNLNSHLLRNLPPADREVYLVNDECSEPKNPKAAAPFRNIWKYLKNYDSADIWGDVGQTQSRDIIVSNGLVKQARLYLEAIDEAMSDTDDGLVGSEWIETGIESLTRNLFYQSIEGDKRMLLEKLRRSIAQRREHEDVTEDYVSLMHLPGEHLAFDVLQDEWPYNHHKLASALSNAALGQDVFVLTEGYLISVKPNEGVRTASPQGTAIDWVVNHNVSSTQGSWIITYGIPEPSYGITPFRIDEAFIPSTESGVSDIDLVLEPFRQMSRDEKYVEGAHTGERMYLENGMFGEYPADVHTDMSWYIDGHSMYVDHVALEEQVPQDDHDIIAGHTSYTFPLTESGTYQHAELKYGGTRGTPAVDSNQPDKFLSATNEILTEPGKTYGYDGFESYHAEVSVGGHVSDHSDTMCCRLLTEGTYRKLNQSPKHELYVRPPSINESTWDKDSIHHETIERIIEGAKHGRQIPFPAFAPNELHSVIDRSIFADTDLSPKFISAPMWRMYSDHEDSRTLHDVLVDTINVAEDNGDVDALATAVEGPAMVNGIRYALNRMLIPAHQDTAEALEEAFPDTQKMVVYDDEAYEFANRVLGFFVSYGLKDSTSPHRKLSRYGASLFKPWYIDETSETLYFPKSIFRREPEYGDQNYRTLVVVEALLDYMLMFGESSGITWSALPHPSGFEWSESNSKSMRTILMNLINQSIEDMSW